MNNLDPNQFGGQMPPRTPQPRVNLKDTTEVVCEKCQNNVFNMGMYMRKVSALMTGTGKPAFVPIEQAIHCVKCGHVNDEFVPAELKANRISLV